jgi:hypothetical protein
VRLCTIVLLLGVHDAGAPVRMLTEQYRMDPLISRFPSQRFYQGLLQVTIALLQLDCVPQLTAGHRDYSRSGV